MVNEATMISAWWLLLAFIGGGFAGVTVAALIRMGAHEPQESPRLPDFDQAGC